MVQPYLARSREDSLVSDPKRFVISVPAIRGARIPASSRYITISRPVCSALPRIGFTGICRESGSLLVGFAPVIERAGVCFFAFKDELMALSTELPAAPTVVENV